MGKALKLLRVAVVPLACVVIFAALSSPGLDEPGLHHDETYQAAEAVLFLKHGSGPVPEVSGIGGSRWLTGRLPWMTLDYIGALKTYLFAGVFLLHRPTARTIRAVTLALGAAAVFFTVLLTNELYGGPWGLALGLWLATDPALALIARHDFGSMILTTALKMAGLYFLAMGARKGAWAFFLGGCCFGLALWDKSHFLWWLAAFAGAALLWLPKPLQGKPWPPAAAGFAAGASPWLLFNLVHPLRTFSALRGAPAGPVWPRAFPDLVRQRWSLFLQMLDGSGFYHAFSGETMPASPLREKLLLALGVLCLLALAVAVLRGRWAVLRHTAFWLSAAAGIFGAACLTPLTVGLHHMPMLYPLPQLAVVSLLAGAAGSLRWNPGITALIALPLAAALALCNAGLVRDFIQAAARTGGSGEWYAGLREVSEFCEKAREPVVTMNLMYGVPLVVYSDGAVVPQEGYPELVSDAGFQSALHSIPGFLKRPGTLVVTYEGPDSLYRPEPFPRRFMEIMTARKPSPLKLVKRILYSNGEPWTAIYQVRSP